MYSRILVPLDGSDLAEQALSHAEGLARSFQATLHLVQVVSLSRDLEGVVAAGSGLGQSVSPTNLDIAQIVIQARRSMGQAYLERLAAQVGANGVQTVTALLEGSADEAILDYVRENEVDCIVLTTQGLSGLRRLFLGSVTDRLIRSSEVPVVVVPPHAG